MSSSSQVRLARENAALQRLNAALGGACRSESRTTSAIELVVTSREMRDDREMNNGIGVQQQHTWCRLETLFEMNNGIGVQQHTW